MRINSDIQLDFDDVLIEPHHQYMNEYDEPMSHREDVNICKSVITLAGTPIMNSNMTQTGTLEIASVLLEEKCFASIHKFYTPEEIYDTMEEYNIDTDRLFITIGIRDKELEITKLMQLANKKCKFSILIDVPNAYIQTVIDYVREIRGIFPNKIIAVGNVCTGEGVKQLIHAGANIVKVGVGPSTVCDTRIKTGVGRPQLSAIMECADVAHKMNAAIIADGGFKNPGDICKAMVAGADICMSGLLFAGTSEAAGDLIEKYYKMDEVEGCEVYDPASCKFEIETGNRKIECKQFKEYYGMSSFRAQKENYGETTKFGTSEGVESKLIEFTGDIIRVIDDIRGGLRSCGTYIGFNSIDDFKYANFYRVNRIK